MATMFAIRFATMRLPVLVTLACLAALSARAHEFWIEPLAYRIGPSETIEARLKVGQMFEGSVYRYFPQQFARFDVVRDGTAHRVTGRLGDDPALTMSGLGDGLLIAVHESTDSILTYTDPQVFRNFVTSKGRADVLDRHAERGLPASGFRETYRRFAKSLIAAGSGAGADARIGLRTEIVALANPYVDDISGGIPLQVWVEGAPRALTQVDVFLREGEGDVTLESYLTDAEGRVTVPARAGAEYLVDAVAILPLPNDDPDEGPVWESLWASLTFRVPGP
jgi:hypothetical protein